MSNPILYATTETNFQSNGIGILTDCISCTVTEEANGLYELSMTYPMDGIHFDKIVERGLLKVKPNQTSNPQLFRIYSIIRPMSGLVTITAAHISYDLSSIPVSAFTAYSAAEALAGLRNNAVINCPFELVTDKTTSATFAVTVPGSIRSKLGGQAGSVLDVYGGEYEFDNFRVILHKQRGADRGVSIRYGKNLTKLQQNRSSASVYTGVYPYWVNMETSEVMELPEKIILAEGVHDFEGIKMLDVSEDFMEPPTEDELRTYARDYVKRNNIDEPRVSVSVSFAQLEQTEEYKGMALLERVSLFDRVNVEFPALGVSITSKAVRLVYNVLLDRVEQVTLGSVNANLSDTIATQQGAIQANKEKPSVSLVQKISQNIAQTVVGAKGGSVRFLDTNGDGVPDELYIADNPDPMQAVRVWRFNYAGWAASKSGYSGPFTMGATLADGLLADFVRAAHLTAGTIQSQDADTFFLDLDNGILRIKAVDKLTESVTALQQNSESVNISVQKILNEGVSTVKTTTGYTFDADGLRIAKTGYEITNLLDNTGMYVTRSGEPMLQANADGVIATDVSVRNYLVMGTHARFEDFADADDSARTACYWI